jgi:hypothetical protein
MHDSWVKLCRATLVAIWVGATPAIASTTHYFYDPSGRFIGQTTQTTQVRSEVFDAEGNRQTYLMQIPHAYTSSQQLLPGQSLLQGESLVSADGSHSVGLQEDGNVVLYNGFTALWATSTSTTAAANFVMQGDGNLVLYDAQNVALWASNTSGNPNAVVVMQTDGNLVIYSANGVALWASGTSGR